MGTTRRGFLAAGAAAAAGVVLFRGGIARGGSALEPGGAYFDWKDAGGRPVAFGEGGNSLLIVGNGGSVLVDCKNAPFGPALRREAAERGGVIELVINTHHHADHTGGNHAFTPDVAVLAHKNCKPRIEPQMNRYISQAKEAVAALTASEKPEAARVREDARAYHDRMNKLEAKEFQPTQLVGDREEVPVRGEKIVLHHFGPGHTDNDLVVHVPGRNLVHCGDLLFHKRHPFLDRESGGTALGWIGAVKKIVELCDQKTVVVPGHGDITDVSGLRGQIEYLEKTRDAVAAAMKEGKTRQEIQRMELPEFKEYGLPQMRERTMRALFEELKESR